MLESLLVPIFGKLVGEWLANFGPLGAGAAAIFAVVFKFFIAPAIGKWIATKQENTLKLFTTLENINSNLTSLSENQQQSVRNWAEAKVDLKEFREELKEVHQNLQIVMDNNSGELDIDDTINMITIYLSLVHTRMKEFYKARTRMNHILKDPILVNAKYIDRAEEYGDKLESQSARYTHKGRPLNEFWGATGAHTYVDEMMHNLYILQLSLARGEKTLVTTEEELDRWFERNISVIIGSIRVWDKRGKSWIEQGGRNLVPKPVQQTDSKIEFLVDLDHIPTHRQTIEGSNDA